jgi:hypothetical protein
VALYTDILHRLARFLAGVPPEMLGAIVLLALQHPGLVAALFAIVVSVLKFALVSIAGNIVASYLRKMFMLHVWPRLPQGLRRFLPKLEDWVLFVKAHQDQAATRDGESGFSRNSKRHPHW